MPSLLLVRHAQASFGAAKYDVLSPTGAEQAAALTQEILRRRLDIRRIVSGDLVRQRDTVAPLAQALGLGVAVDHQWNEYDTNDILSAHSATTARQERPAGANVPEISSRDFQGILETALTAWIAAGADGPADETWPRFASRIGAALGAAADGLRSGETAVVCTSAGVLAAAAVALLDLGPASLIGFNRVAVNAAISKIAVGATGPTLVSFNDHGHLELRGTAPLLTYR